MKLSSLIEKGAPISRTINIHPVFLVGVTIFLVGVGVFVSETMLESITTSVGITAIVWAVVWIMIGVVTMVAGITASRMEGEE